MYYRSYLKDVLPGSIYISFRAKTSHDHRMELRKLKRQKEIEVKTDSDVWCVSVCTSNLIKTYTRTTNQTADVSLTC